MEHDVVETCTRLLGQLRIEADVLRGWIAAAPLAAHRLNEQLVDPYIQTLLPESNQLSGFLPQLIAVPGRQDALTFLQSGARPEGKDQMSGVNLNPGRGIHLLDVEQQPLAPERVGFTLDDQPGTLPLLSRKSSLLPADPAQFADGVSPHMVWAHALRR
jgi:hypothetical protein